eukprot:CAMPEP_0183731332 /NCGR_PEP_ID=MMETSP0737-20130205/35073_1 /TAXON_ID=385413 /ORGANISM="Thalassiosira miniscula, Strain CCMP1093" /LENGTH=577 /DNA_ID=CAMNT_0025964033 /DNA_START=70 /DNA_END=1803 /DNA_ORIENTATION=-
MAAQFHPLHEDVEGKHELEEVPPRSIDDYLESAYRHSAARRYPHNSLLLDILEHWRYYIIFLALGIANSGDAAEMGAISYILGSAQFQHDILMKDGEDGLEEEIDFAGRGAAIAGSHFAGMLISGLLSGILADIWGRRSTLLTGLVCNGIVGLLSVGARNATELCLLRFMLGAGLGMVIAGVVTLCAEVAPPSNRGRFMTLVGACYTLGFLYVAICAVAIFRGSGSDNWRLFMFMNALPTIVSATLVFLFLPESPRFFLSRGRTREAVHVLNVIASRIGYVDNVLTEEELTQYLFQAKKIGEASSRAKDAIANETSNYAAPEQSTIKEICMNLAGLKQVYMNGLHRRTLPLQMAYFCLTLATGVMQWWTKIFQMLDLEIDAYVLSFYHTCAQIPGMMLATGLIDYVGRRRFVIIGFSSGSVILTVLSAIVNPIKKVEEEIADSGEGGGGQYSFLILVMACLYSISLCVAWLSLDCLSAESYPTKVRSTGRGVCVATGRMAGFCVQFLYGPLINQGFVSRMLGLASVFSLAGVVISCQTTDTTNIDLQDHWDYAKEGGAANGDENAKRGSFAETTHID